MGAIACGAQMNKPSGEPQQAAVSSPADGGRKLLFHEVEDVVQAHKPELRTCYDAETRRDPQLRTRTGRIVVDMKVAPAGTVLDSRISKTTLKNPTVEDCVLHQISSWQFPACAEESIVRIPFVFGNGEPVLGDDRPAGGSI
jgi:hypothetical protein